MQGLWRWISLVGSCVVVLAAVGGKAWSIADHGALYNWDIIGYAACAASYAHSEPEAVSEATYADIKSGFPAERYTTNVERGHYGITIHRKPKVLAQQKRFYCQRALYNASLAALKALGVGYVEGTTALSLVPFVLTGLLLFVWLTHHLPPPIAAAGAIGLSLNYATVYTARTGSPDSLCALLVLLAAYLALRHRALALSLLALCAAIATRPDAAVFGVLAILAIGLSPRSERPPLWVLAVATLGMVGLYVAISAWFQHPGWWSVFHFSMVRRTPYLHQVPTHFDASVYLDVLSKRWSGLWGETLFVHVGAGAVVAWGLARGASLRSLPAASGVALAATLTCVARYLLFPAMFLRLYLPYFLLIEVLALVAIAGAARQALQSPAASSPG